MSDTDPLRVAIQSVLWNVSNYPRRAQVYMLGQDNGPLTDKVTKAVRAALTDEVFHGWFTSHSSAAIARVIADGQSVIDERMADGVFD